VLYQARIHPACPTNQLSEQNVIDLHRQLHVVPTKAVEVNADSTMFPEDWLFRWRWSKGKKQAKGKKKAAEDDEEASLGDLKPKGLDYLPLVRGWRGRSGSLVLICHSLTANQQR
jgi:formamidopyrimidine-DNA glycosylase